LPADWIPPDITGDVFKMIRWPENMIVVAHLPESTVVRLAKFVGRALLEQTNELAQVATLVGTLDEKMNVVWH